MLTLVEIRNPQGDLLSLPLEDTSNGYAIKDIGGLDPVKATLVSTNFPKKAGAQFQTSHREARNITMLLGLYPDYATSSVAALRDNLYSFLMPDSPVDLRFYDDRGLTANISGHVETCDCPLFTQKPQASLSIVCFDPDFVDLTSTHLTGSTVSTSTETTISYTGSIETGFVFTLNVNRTLSAFTIYFRQPDGILRTLDFAASLVSGDVVTISTVSGNKYVSLLRSGTTSLIAYAVTPQSNWHELKRGDNTIRVYATGAAIPYTVDYTTRYGGL